MLGFDGQAHIADLEEALASLAQPLRRMPEVWQVILFGSFAAGRRDVFSDRDLVVVKVPTRDFVSRNASWPVSCGPGTAGRTRLYSEGDRDLASAPIHATRAEPRQNVV